MRLVKTIGWGVLLTGASAMTLVAQDAMVMGGVVGGSSLPPGVSAAPAPMPAPMPAPVLAPVQSSAPVRSQFTGRAVSSTTTPGIAPSAPASVPMQGLPAQPFAPASAPGVNAWAPQQLPVRRAEIPAETRGYFPGRENPTGLRGTQAAPDYRSAQAVEGATGGSSLPPGVSGGSTLPPQTPATTGYPSNYPQAQTTPQPQAPRSWAQKLGLGNISTRVFGHIKGGAAARNEDTLTATGVESSSWEEAFVGDAFIGGEVSAFTQSGIEYGLNVGLRGAYDGDGVLFGGNVGNCAVGGLGCPGQLANTGQSLPFETVALRGHTSQLFTGLRGFQDEERIALESAHLFLRTGYGDITVGRDVGAGELFSLGAPTLLQMGLNNGRVDYTSLDIVTTANDATGYSEKITYTSPRLGGDIIGLSAQVGASYTPDVDACGAYACFRRNGSDKAAGSVGATLSDAWEIAVSLERKLGDIDAEITGSYARASAEQSLAAFDDLESWNIGAEFNWQDFQLGGSYLSSNNALSDGDYTAYDIGLTYAFEAMGGTWGAGVGFANAKDDNVAVESDQYQVGLTREIGKFNVGTGVQYIERTVPGIGGTPIDEKATAVFVETGFDF